VQLRQIGIVRRTLAGVTLSLCVSGIAIAQPQPAGSAFQINMSGDEAEDSSVVMAADGTFVVAWTDDDSESVLARRFDATGSPIADAFAVSTSSGEHKEPSIAMADDGRFTIVWEADDDEDVLARVFTATGSPVTGEIQVSASSDENKTPSIAMAPDGTFVVAWEAEIEQEGEEDQKGIWARRFDAVGNPVTSSIQVSTSGDENESPSIAMADDGRFTIVWEEDESENIFARQFDAAANPVASAFQVSSLAEENQDPRIAMAANGTYVVTWGSEDEDDRLLWARQYDAAGNPIASEFQVNSSAEEQKHSRIAMADDGRFTIVWEDDDDVFAQEFDASGNPVGSAFQVNSTTDENEDPDIAINADGNLIVVWTEKDNDDIMGQRYGGSASVFTSVSASTGFNLISTTEDDEPSGLHFADYDNDGDLDAIITGDGSAYYLSNTNQGQSFAASIFGGGERPGQGAMVDVENDGDLDFWHADERLFSNGGSASFSDVGDAGFGEAISSSGVATADIDNDGYADLLMFSDNGNWIGFHDGKVAPTFSGTDDPSYGLVDAGSVGPGGFVAAGDVNNDGRLDFYYHYNGGKLFLSQSDGTFVQNASGISVSTDSDEPVGATFGDYDNDGDLDLFVPQYESGSFASLWRNDNGTFTDVAVAAGITNSSGQRGAAFGDFDNDGDLDLYVGTDSATNVLYENQGDGTFVETFAGASTSGDTQDVAFVDFDNDGDLDIAMTQEDATNVLLENTTNDFNYLKVRVVGHGAAMTNKAAIGVRVELYAADGTTFIARREIGVASGFGGAEPMWLHFGGVDPNATYVVKAYMAHQTLTAAIVPSAVSTTIGSTTIPQMLTLTETAPQLAGWREISPQ
jgi:FG-GAP-like repeat